MYSSYTLIQGLALVYFLVIQVLIRSVSSLNLTSPYLTHKCRVGEKNYQSRSKYENNLNSSLSDLLKNDFENGYSHKTKIDPPNSVTILYWCRRDSYGAKCRSCLDTAVAGLRSRCKRETVGMIWYDQCFLDFSGDKRRIKKTDYANPLFLHSSKNMVGDIKSFNKNIIDFLYKLTRDASRLKKVTEEPINYAAGEKMFGKNKMYAMVQCVQFISIALCKDCLESNIRQLSKCCDGKQGATVLTPICIFRYELYPFLAT